MKKIFALVLALALCLSLCACGLKDAESPKAPETDTTETEKDPTVSAWKALQTAGEFGDYVPNGESLVSSAFTGTFSNTATDESNLNVIVYVYQNADTHRYYVGFRLLEYNDNPIFYLSDYEESISLKINVGGFDEVFDLVKPV